MTIANSIFKTFVLSLLIMGQVHFSYAQTASILPPAKTTFVDQNGKPLTLGTVDFYIPNTSTRKTTWQDAAETIPNSNPVTLDAAGRALILGSGSYRQVVKDRLGNVIWDQVTSSTGSGGSTPITATGDGDLVGTIKPWAGMTAPNQYAFTYGQELSRTAFSVLFTAITSTQPTFCNIGSPTLNGLSDTTNFWIGMSVEVSCVAAGFSTIISKTSNSVTLAVNANVSTNTTATFFPWGRGNGTTTFNLPDFRGLTLVGNNIMGGVASSNMSATYYGASTPNSTGGIGGNEQQTLALANLPPYTPAGTITNGAISFNSTPTAVAAGGSVNGMTMGTTTNPAVATIVSSQATSTFSGTAQGGTSTPFSRVMPSRTTNYIIKITPDSNSATASGVTSIQGMTGGISCGAGLTCTGNNISSTISAFGNPTGTIGLTAVNGVNTTVMRSDSAPALSQAIVPTWTGTHTFNNGTYSFLATNPAGFAGQTTPAAPIHVGTASVTSLGATIVSAKANTGSANVHGFADNTTINLGAAGLGVNSYDALPVYSGTQNYDHYAAFQSRPTYGSSGTITHIYGTYHLPLINSGTVTNSYAGYSANPTGAGTLTNAYGFYSEAITKGSTLNYAFFSAGTTKSKFTGGLEGTTTNDNACAGCIGEYIESIITSGSATSLTSATAKTVTSISLTAGDWDVTGTNYFIFGTGTTATDFRTSLSTTTNTEDTTAGRFAHLLMPTLTGTGITQSTSIPSYRFSLSGTTTIFLVAQATFGVSTMTAYGIIRARRIR